ncbi:flavin-containing monooxygenase FMO GS-OX5-like [Ziziphus jujuba]|uniref:Flavin-containing monooxygenase n=1 Tax=Ziziphus jujuba TaxID=326968 RepID=A0ABM4A296_ZIZJJ|nr:flavin-containing monooxygenase FMO GS-OX5-like [Ziziphus jujuba]
MEFSHPRQIIWNQEEMLWFLNKFADDFGLVELVRFNSEVVRVEQIEERDKEWSVEWRTRGCDSVSREVFESVVVCTGHQSVPQLPAVAGIEKWPGYQIHSHNYRVPEPFKDQIVVVIAYAASGFEISREIATEAKQVHIATRVPNIDHVCEGGKVVFQDGSFVYADTILYSTGHKYHYPFLETNGIVTVEHVFPPRLAPRLSSIGIPDKAQVLSGKMLLPKEEEMMTSIEELYRQMEENGLPKRHTHTMYPNGIEYHNWLFGQIGLPPQEWRGNMFVEIVKKMVVSMNDGYRDEWDEAYWDSFIKVCNYSLSLTYMYIYIYIYKM